MVHGSPSSFLKESWIHFLENPCLPRDMFSKIKSMVSMKAMWKIPAFREAFSKAKRIFGPVSRVETFGNLYEKKHVILDGMADVKTSHHVTLGRLLPLAPRRAHEIKVGQHASLSQQFLEMNVAPSSQLVMVSVGPTIWISTPTTTI